MRSRAINLTPEQVKYRNEILKVKTKPAVIKKKVLPIFNSDVPADFMGRKIYYLNNCVFWLNEFKEGRADKKRLQEIIVAIEKICSEIRVEIL